MENNNTEMGYSPNALDKRQHELLALLRQTAPEVISDNQIDIEKLKELIGQDRIAPAEHYELSWAGKAAARREIQKTTSHTLLPVATNPPIAPHMLIEGENLEVLRALQKSYHGKVKMIYIDPPYNTGSDSFVYPDDYSETLDEYQKRTGEKNEAGYLNKQSLWKKNTKESGQYHSAWLSMMYPRLYLARNLLRDDGVIFISIDDHEAANLKLLCDEVFGAENFVESIVWEKKSSAKGVPPRNMMVNVHEYILTYQKTENFRFGGEKRDEAKDGFKNPDNDPRGPWRESNIKSTTKPIEQSFTIVDPNTGREYTNTWAFSKESLDRMIAEERILWKESLPKQKEFMAEMTNENKAIKSSWGVFDPQGTTVGLKKLLPEVKFDNPKPINLMEYLIQVVAQQSDIILDFFAGSGTTAQAVIELNLEDGGNRQCICVQMPEVLEETSEAYKAGYRTIADITRARIDKVIANLKAEHPEKTADLACAHFILAPSNFKVWRGDVAEEAALRESLDLFQTAEKSGHSHKTSDAQTAMLAELLLKLGLGVLGVHAISKPIQLAGVTVHRVLMHNDQQLWLCFEPYSSALKEEITKAKPAQVVLLNSCFVGDKADELLSNLQLELAGLDVGLTII